MKPFLKQLFDKMNIKIQRAAVHGTTANKGSSKTLVNYINHEDADRIAAGKTPLSFETPLGEEKTAEEVIEAIDQNAKGLCKSDDKFYHIVISPSEAEIKAMGKTEEEIKGKARILMKAFFELYAGNFHRDGLKASNLVAFWKIHFTRGDKDEYQFHIHVVISRKTKGLPGKQMKISPLTNHRNTEEGAVKGGFEREALFKSAEKMFDQMMNYDRSVSETYDYCNAMAHGSVQEKAEQAEKLAAENAPQLENAIRTGIERRRKRLEMKADVDEIAALLDGEDIVLSSSTQKNALDDAMCIAEAKNLILTNFAKAKDKQHLGLSFVSEGYTFYVVKATDVPGVDDFRFVKRGKEFRASDIMSEAECHSLLDHWHRLGGSVPAYKTREKMALKPVQKKYGGPKLGRR